MLPLPLSLPANFNPRRILIVKPSALGDVVHTLPLLPLLRTRFPLASISWLVAPAFAGIVAGHPSGVEVIPFDRRRLSDAASRGAAGVFGVISLADDLRNRDFDLVIDLQGLLRSALLTFATAAPVRIGFDYAREGAPLAYTHRVPSRGTERHAIERYLDVAESLGCSRGPIAYQFPVNDGVRVKVAEMLRGRSAIAVLVPGTNWNTKKWPIDHYARLAEMLRARLGLFPVIAGGADVLPLAERVPDAVNLANRTTLPQLVALMERADLVVANDSGPMHIAAALGRPLVTIFGPTNPVRTGPHRRDDTVIRLDLICSPCYSRHCSHTSCMNWLTPERVFEQAQRTLSSRESLSDQRISEVE